MYENYYHEELVKISTCAKYSIDAYDRYILPKYVFPFFYGNLNSCNYYGDSINVMCPWLPNCFLPFPLVLSHVSPGVYMVSFGVSPVFYSVSPVSNFRFCDKSILFSIKYYKILGRTFQKKRYEILVVEFISIFIKQ